MVAMAVSPSSGGAGGHAQRLVGDAFAAAGQGDPAGAGQLADAVGVEQLEHGLDLGRAAGGLDGQGVGADVDDLGPEHLGQLDDLVADRRVGLDLDQDQLALHRLVVLELDDLEHVDQLVELLGDLLQGRSAQSTTIVMRLRPGSSVGPTASESMLKPRRLNSPEMRARTPGLSSTSTEMVWVLIRSAPPCGSRPPAPRERTRGRG